MYKVLTSMPQAGIQDVMISVDDAGCDEQMAEVILDALDVLGTIMVVGASLRFQELMKLGHEAKGRCPFEDISHVATRSGPTFGGYVLH
jgi:hypothetical protein